MGRDRPEITKVTSFFATRLPIQGVEKDRAARAWWRMVTKARANGSIDRLMRAVADMDPEDDQLRRVCEYVAEP